jgi:hypothetical protein
MLDYIDKGGMLTAIALVSPRTPQTKTAIFSNDNSGSYKIISAARASSSACSGQA